MNRLFMVILTTLLLPGMALAHHHDEDVKQVRKHDAVLFIEPNLEEEQKQPAAATLEEQRHTHQHLMQPELERR
ncbi:MAG: hypothetical protein OXD47_07200 [Gammaproteobacteria bacterium]|nr:hypothetical protein [Gammaproteobacteria bacterium]MCY4281725.1 hypothetical protein [Gammaproteobacteria bacterium]MCY4338574.1 hypothetical protein [Gammaproteobacteria bacterium]